MYKTAIEARLSHSTPEVLERRIARAESRIEKQLADVEVLKQGLAESRSRQEWQAVAFENRQDAKRARLEAQICALQEKLEAFSAR